MSYCTLLAHPLAQLPLPTSQVYFTLSLISGHLHNSCKVCVTVSISGPLNTLFSTSRAHYLTLPLYLPNCSSLVSLIFLFCITLSWSFLPHPSYPLLHTWWGMFKVYFQMSQKVKPSMYACPWKHGLHFCNSHPSFTKLFKNPFPLARLWNLQGKAHGPQHPVFSSAVAVKMWKNLSLVSRHSYIFFLRVSSFLAMVLRYEYLRM